MSNINIAAIVGSLREDSLNRKFLNALIKQAPKGVTVTELSIGKLPVYNQDLDYNFPQSVSDFKGKVQSSHAVLFVTPEHNRSIPSALKNAIDWANRPWGENAWDKKPAALVGATMGNVGTFGAQNHLRQILTAVGTYTLAKPEIYFTSTGRMSDEGVITDESSKELIDSFWASFVEWIGKFQA